MKLILAVGKATALFLLAVLALLTVQPESAELSLDFLFPSIFGLHHLRLSLRLVSMCAHVRVRMLAGWSLKSCAHLNAVKGIFVSEGAVAVTVGRRTSAVSHG